MGLGMEVLGDVEEEEKEKEEKGTEVYAKSNARR